ncbi:hypothetical protein Tco_0674659, partial [Tanacetum coccineum]
DDDGVDGDGSGGSVVMSTGDMVEVVSAVGDGGDDVGAVDMVVVVSR